MSGKISNKIVTDGLVLYLDAANPRSYVIGATAWNDISNINNGVLTNGPSFSSSNNGSISFDGVNDYCNIPSNPFFAYGTGDFTWDIWVKPIRFNNNDYLIDHGSNGGTIAFDGAGYTTRYYNTTTSTSSPLFIPGFGSSSPNNWYNLVASRLNGITYLYKNGIFQISGSDTHSYGAQDLNIGRYGGSSNFTQGNISNVKIYKGKGLTSTEVLQNYNALKSRFGL